MQILKQGEHREWELQELVKKGKRPVALFVDEAHALNSNTLTGRWKWLKTAVDGCPLLKLRNDLRRPTMEEIGYPTDIFIAGRDHRQPARIYSVVAED